MYIFYYCCSVAKSCLTSLQPHARQHSRRFLSPTISQSLPKFMYTNMNMLVMPSNHRILCHPLLLPSIFPSFRVFTNESALRIKWPKYWSFSFSISPSSEYEGFISFRIDWYKHMFYIFKYTLQVYTHTCTHIYTQHTYTHMYTHNTHIYTHIYTYTHTHKCIYTRIHTIHIQTYIYIYNHTHTHIHTIYIYTHRDIYTYTDIHTHRDTHIHTYICTHTCVYIYMLPLQLIVIL